MAAPNLKSLTTVTPLAWEGALTTDNLEIISNAAASGKVIVVTELTIANIDGTNPADVTVTRTDSSNNHYNVIKTGSVPADSVLLPIDNDNKKIVLEGCSIWALASANADLHYTGSGYELS
jgi:hypothetical protein